MSKTLAASSRQQFDLWFELMLNHWNIGRCCVKYHHSFHCAPRFLSFARFWAGWRKTSFVHSCMSSCCDKVFGVWRSERETGANRYPVLSPFHKPNAWCVHSFVGETVMLLWQTQIFPVSKILPLKTHAKHAAWDLSQTLRICFCMCITQLSRNVQNNWHVRCLWRIACQIHFGERHELICHVTEYIFQQSPREYLLSESTPMASYFINFILRDILHYLESFTYHKVSIYGVFSTLGQSNVRIQFWMNHSPHVPYNVPNNVCLLVY